MLPRSCIYAAATQALICIILGLAHLLLVGEAQAQFSMTMVLIIFCLIAMHLSEESLETATLITELFLLCRPWCVGVKGSNTDIPDFHQCYDWYK
jgi:hypothetical protein